MKLPFLERFIMNEKLRRLSFEIKFLICKYGIIAWEKEEVKDEITFSGKIHDEWKTQTS